MASSSSNDTSDKSMTFGQTGIKIDSIQKLVGASNYQTWRDTAEYLLTNIVLEEVSMWDIVSGVKTEPSGKATEKETQVYKRLERQCSLFFLQAVESQWHPILAATKKPHLIWKALENKFGIENPRTFFFQYKSLMHLKLEDRNKISDHLTHFETEWLRFQHRCAQGKETDKLQLPRQLHEFAQSEQAKATVLLTSLPDDMDNIVDNLVSKDLTYEEVFARLMDLGNKDGGKEDKAYKAKQQRKDKQKSQVLTKGTNSEKNEGCSYCRKYFPKTKFTTHTWQECRKLQADKEKGEVKKGGPQTSDQKESARRADESDSERVSRTSTSSSYSPWILDTGASSHMTSKLDLLMNIKSHSSVIRIADDSGIHCDGVGEVRLDCKAPDDTSSEVTMEKVMYVPELGHYSLMSWQAVDRKKYRLIGEDDWLYIQDRKSNKVIVWANIVNKQFIVQESEEMAKIVYEEWHQAICHASPTTINKDLYEDGDDIPPIPKDFHCNTCALSKSTKKIPSLLETHAKAPMEKCHTDLSGKFTVPSLGGANYYVTLIDEYTRFAWIRFLKNKSQAGAAVKSMIRQAERSTGRKLKNLRSDNGGEYIAMDPFFEDEGINHEYSPAYSHESNGMAERFNRTLITMARSMLNSSGFDLKLWAEAISTALHTKNRLPHQGFENKKTPYEALNAEKPSISHLQPFGRKCYVHISEEERVGKSKLLPRAEEGHVVGYNKATNKIYRIYFPSKRRVTEERQVTFAPLSDSRTNGDQDKQVQKASIPTMQIEIPAISYLQRQQYTSHPMETEEAADNDQETPYHSPQPEVQETSTQEEHQDESNDKSSEDTDSSDSSSSDSESDNEDKTRQSAGQEQIRPRIPSPPPQKQHAEEGTPRYLGRGYLRSSVRRQQDAERLERQRSQASSTISSVGSGSDKTHRRSPSPRPEASSSKPKHQEEQRERQRSKRTKSPPKKDRRWFKAAKRALAQDCPGTEHAMAAAHAYAALIEEEPLNYQDAVKSDQASSWEIAMKEELKALKKANTWTIVDKPAKRSVVSCKWVYKIKQNPDGSIARYKARLVARGFTQRPGFDYDETFSPVVRYESLRLLLAISAHHGWKPQQCDVKSAFLHGDLQEEIYMELPPGHGQPGKVAKLNKCLYGLKQSSREWYAKLSKSLEQKGFVPAHFDPCVFIHKKDRLYISVYVDDLAFYGPDQSKIAKIIKQLESEFEVTNLGDATWLLGIHIEYSEQGITLSQCTYIDKVLKRFGMEKSRPVSTPLQENIRLQIGTKENIIEDISHYQSIIGSLMYAVIGSRPDLAHTITLLSQFNSCPTEEHVRAVKHTLRYLSGTRDWKLHYPTRTLLALEGFSDSSYASCPDTRRSFSGNVFRLGRSTITWESQKQKSVATSTTEAEYMALSLASRQIIWLKRALRELGIEVRCALRCDNTGAIDITENPKINKRTKHIDIAYHYTREKLLDEEFLLMYVDTGNNLADLLTKPLGRKLHNKFAKLLTCDSEEE